MNTGQQRNNNLFFVLWWNCIVFKGECKHIPWRQLSTEENYVPQKQVKSKENQKKIKFHLQHRSAALEKSNTTFFKLFAFEHTHTVTVCYISLFLFFYLMGIGELKHDCKASIRVRLERFPSRRPASVITSCAAFGKNMKPPFSWSKKHQDH